jgi:hypothetical protein
MVFLFCKVITQIKGIISKSPKINIKYVYIIVYDANICEYVSINYKVHVCILHASVQKILLVLGAFFSVVDKGACEGSPRIRVARVYRGFVEDVKPTRE